MTRVFRAGVVLVSSWLLLSAACNAIDRGEGDGDPNGPGKTMPGPGPGPQPQPTPPGHLRGKVVAPEGTIPIAGALVYLTTTQPAEIPDGVYCDKCVHLPDGTPHTTTRTDGSFDLDAPAGSYKLVVQKGAFRRVRALQVMSGDQTLARPLTTLPSITDKAAGDDIPKIAVVLGAWDPIEIVLAKMGLKATITKPALGKPQVLVKDAPAFAIYGQHYPFEPTPYPSPNVLLTDPKELGKYHIVFLPCSGSVSSGEPTSGPACSGVYNYDARVKTTLDDFVKRGGRVYASDWHYEYVRQPFPGYISWSGETSQIGSACKSGGGDQPVNKADTGLTDWLGAQGQSLPSVKDAWTQISSVMDRMGPDADGKIVKITPRVWVQASGAPVSTSIQHGCGRVFYTTYHTQPTAEIADPLQPQALALLYMILEVGVCIDPVVIG